MIDLLIEATSIPAAYTIYIGILFSLIVNLLWNSSVGNKILRPICHSTYILFRSPCLSLRLKNQRACNPIVIWILRFVRKKYGTVDDDNEDAISSRMSTSKNRTLSGGNIKYETENYLLFIH
ncbi:hypothetical protein J9303_16765 [Bacillaceae bacterium Marseille-Q3522]|nr:hypothetical protein [Bacillaceae bacterium Marseille-Q3522]